MQQEKDYLQRDIERITLFLKILLRKVAGLTNNDFQPQYDQLEKDLKEQVDFSIQELNQLDAAELKDKLASLHLAHIESIAEIAFEILKKSSPKHKERFLRNILLMIDYVNDNSDSISLQRIHIREEVAKHL